MLLQVPEELETVHARHDQIRNDDIRTEGGEPFERFLSIRRNLRLLVIIGEHGGQGGTLALVIVDDQDAARNSRFSGHRSYHSKPHWNQRLRETSTVDGPDLPWVPGKVSEEWLETQELPGISG